MNYKELKLRYFKRHLTRIVNITRDNPLGLTAILVYSCLVNRATHNKGCRQATISRATSLHESTAVPAALKVLREHGLAEKRGAYWWAVEPTLETLQWFRYRQATEGQKWARRFSYWWTGVRKSKAPLTTVQTVLLFKLANLSGRRVTVRGLAKLLGVDTKTVMRALKKLKAENLVDADLLPNKPTTEQVKWFRVRHEQPPFVLSQQFGSVFEADCDEAILTKRLVDRAGELLLAADFSERQAVEYIDSVLRTAKRWPIIFAFMSAFETFFNEVAAQHKANVAAGKYMKAKNCRGLLAVETEKKLKRLAVARYH